MRFFFRSHFFLLFDACASVEFKEKRQKFTHFAKPSNFPQKFDQRPFRMSFKENLTIKFKFGSNVQTFIYYSSAKFTQLGYVETHHLIKIPFISLTRFIFNNFIYT